MPENCVSVTRPGRWGNPFNWKEGIEIGGEHWAKQAAVDLYREWIFHPERHPDKPKPPSIENIKKSLRGKDLACFCQEDEPCHSTVLLCIANEP